MLNLKLACYPPDEAFVVGCAIFVSARLSNKSFTHNSGNYH